MLCGKAESLMPKTVVKLKGLKEALSTVKGLARKYPEAGFRALVRQGELAMTDSKDNYVPVDEGQMRASGHVVPEKDKKQVTLGFCGPAGIGNQGESNKEDVGYAVIQHEGIFEHTVGTDHYLQKPLDARSGSMGKDMANDIKSDVLLGKA